MALEEGEGGGVGCKGSWGGGVGGAKHLTFMNWLTGALDL